MEAGLLEAGLLDFHLTKRPIAINNTLIAIGLLFVYRKFTSLYRDVILRLS